MFCGSASLTHIDDDLWEPSTPTCGLRRKVNKNPYSDRGLDKFEKVLAELEARKEKIVSETGSEGPIPVIHFVYSNSQEWVPIIVRPPPSQEKKQEPPIKGAMEANNKIILILLCLVVSGRIFAIFFTSIWWYFVPTIRGRGVSHSKRGSMKDYRRRLSEKKLGGDVKKAKIAGDGLASPRNLGKKG
ncbi:hypothetical protein QJS04_geneDACA006233 [Acorus gramineus]|uniref:Uncharacterized protein n=1 Tax=Acorus gramineus TaxID=55184 RepID=A0AAV9AZ56_ACOGR|nr:hypothetical protein QJS04_geneDACA006233 [Acorus gramineus]